MQISIHKTQQNIAVLGEEMKYPQHIRSLPLVFSTQVRIEPCREESISITSQLDNLCNALWCCSKHLFWRELWSFAFSIFCWVSKLFLGLIWPRQWRGDFSVVSAAERVTTLYD